MIVPWKCIELEFFFAPSARGYLNNKNVNRMKLFFKNQVNAIRGAPTRILVNIEDTSFGSQTFVSPR